jgi:hypothetical protein
MSFSVVLNGEKIHEMDIDPRLVTGVRLLTAAGEAGVGGSPLRGLGSDSINIVLDIQQPNTLPMVEDDARLAAEENKNEATTYNENARREAAIQEVDAEFRKKAEENPDKDLTDEYQTAREAAATGAPSTENKKDDTDTSTDDELDLESEPAPLPKAEKATAKK